MFYLQAFKPVLEQCYNLEMRTKAASPLQDSCGHFCLTIIIGSDIYLFFSMSEHGTEPECIIDRLEIVILWLGQQEKVVARRTN